MEYSSDDDDMPADDFGDDNKQWLTPKGKKRAMQGNIFYLIITYEDSVIQDKGIN